MLLDALYVLIGPLLVVVAGLVGYGMVFDRGSMAGNMLPAPAAMLFAPVIVLPALVLLALVFGCIMLLSGFAEGLRSSRSTGLDPGVAAEGAPVAAVEGE